MKILLTGIAGFIGFYVCKYLIERGDEVIGLDNINNYYNINLKYARLSLLGINQEDIGWYKLTTSVEYNNFRFVRMNLEDRQAMQMLFVNEKFDKVCHLAAQAGVRYSIENPYTYIESNIDGFINILEGCRHTGIKHLIYASSSSVYGLNEKVTFSEKDSIAHPVSLYAATKKSNELMAHVYSHLYKIPSTGLRFFTVYGPWGRPDMSPFLFADAIINKRPIRVFNNGNMLRDFTYIDDITESIIRVIDTIAVPSKEWDPTNPNPASSSAPYKIYNIGNSHPVKLMDFIQAIENEIGSEAEKQYLPMQPGDIYQTCADTSSLQQDIQFKPNTLLAEGVKRTMTWFKSYYCPDNNGI